jgi:hypothetical protein
MRGEVVMKYKTIREAAEAWVREFNAIPERMIAKLMEADIDDWTEVTYPAPGDRVYVYQIPEDGSGHEGEISSYDIETDLYAIEMDDGKLVSCSRDDFEVERYGGLPMWGTMWSFGDSCDDYWLEEMGGIRIMSECGFRIYQSEEFGYFFGIDGAGYDFYEAHFCPLYKARGLRWHETEEAD